MTRDHLNGRVALVTGASRGIGRAIALALAREGADIAVNYRSNEGAAAEVCAEVERLGRKAIMVKADVANETEVTAMIKTIRRELGPISILVNNAGIGRMRSIDEITEADWDEMVATNLKATFLVTQTVLPDMRARRWGRIIGLSSVAAQMGGVVGPHYAASKGGVQGLMHYYAGNLAKEGITAISVAPGPVATDMAAELPQLKPESIPIGRFGTPDEIAEVAVMLACNGYITGQTINVNGGRYPS
jgi:3-oxoacyl-[acyl-carrier protein] reductase